MVNDRRVIELFQEIRNALTGVDKIAAEISDIEVTRNNEELWVYGKNGQRMAIITKRQLSLLILELRRMQKEQANDEHH